MYTWIEKDSTDCSVLPIFSIEHHIFWYPWEQKYMFFREIRVKCHFFVLWDTIKSGVLIKIWGGRQNLWCPIHISDLKTPQKGNILAISPPFQRFFKSGGMENQSILEDLYIKRLTHVFNPFLENASIRYMLRVAEDNKMSYHEKCWV